MKDYVSFSTWSNYQDCEFAALARDKGELEFETTEPMIVSKYIEANLIGTEEDIKKVQEEHPEMMNSRTGEPKVAYTRALKAVEEAKEDMIFMTMLQGEKQVKLEGVIDGVKVLGYADNVGKAFISDLKAVANLNRVWDERERRRVSFVENRNYAVQGWLYLEMYRQMTGDELNFYLAVLTKEDPSKRVIVTFDQESMNYAETMFRSDLRRIIELREGRAKPIKCGQCEYCVKNSTTSLVDSRLVGMSRFELRAYQEYLEKEGG